jgi:hypothetical protein
VHAIASSVGVRVCLELVILSLKYTDHVFNMALLLRLALLRFGSRTFEGCRHTTTLLKLLFCLYLHLTVHACGIGGCDATLLLRLHSTDLFAELPGMTCAW